MKRLFLLVLMFVTFNASALEINSRLSGIWYNANQSGHGLNIAVLDENTTIVYWYVYHTDGTPMFLITVGQNQGNRVTGTTYYNTGMKFGNFNPNDIKETVWGTSTVTFSDCNTATLQYSSNVSGYGSGTISMQRLASVSGLKCSDSPLHGNYVATVVDPAGIGFGIATLFANGDMAYFGVNESGGVSGLGQWQVTSSDHFVFNATSFSLFGGWVEVSGTGTFHEYGFDATYTGGGRIVAGRGASFQQSLNGNIMAGAYTIYDALENNIGNATVETNGNISGSTINGCAFAGGYYIPDTNFNQAYLDVDVSNCGNTTWIVGSLVYIASEQTLIVIGADGMTGYVWTLKK